MGSRLPNAPQDAEIARIAGRQHGVIALAQLEAAGIQRRAITRRLKASRLHRLHRGVYAVGHRGLSTEGQWMAAVLACGPGSALSHLSAAALWGMLRSRTPASGQPSPGVAHVTVRGEGKSRRGIRVHRSRTLFSSEVTRRVGIPVTTPSRTLLDLRRTLPEPQFAAALRQAEYLGLPISGELELDHTRSELEARFLALCRRHRLPKPAVNVRVGSFIADFLWPVERLIVELDGYGAHRGRVAFEADRERDTQLKLQGYEVVRFTWRQLIDQPRHLASTMRTLLRTHRQ